jgi:Cu+-exporting ATPase
MLRNPEVSGAIHLPLRHRQHPHGVDVKRSLQIPVYGLGCGGAGGQAIERELGATRGVRHCYVNAATETAYVDYDPSETDPWAIARAVERAGYRAGRPVEA